MKTLGEISQQIYAKGGICSPKEYEIALIQAIFDEVLGNIGRNELFKVGKSFDCPNNIRKLIRSRLKEVLKEDDE